MGLQCLPALLIQPIDRGTHGGSFDDFAGREHLLRLIPRRTIDKGAAIEELFDDLAGGQMGEGLTDMNARCPERTRELIPAEFGAGPEPLLADSREYSLNNGVLVNAAGIDRV